MLYSSHKAASHCNDAAEVPIVRVFAISSLACVVVLLGLLRLLEVPVLPFVLVGAGAALLWIAFRYPTIGMGASLAFMPVYPLTFLVAKFFGPSYVASFEGCDRILILLFTIILWRRNRITLCAPDWLLLTCFGLALIRLPLGGHLLGLLSDFNFMIAYAAGRVTVLNAEERKRWAKRAVWVVAVLSVVGMIEVFFIGPAPRTLLYLSVANGGTQGQSLDAAFHADEYLGLRESSTMFGPLQFAPLCMAALVIWWVYRRDWLPAAMIVSGLVCSVTRSAWVGTAVAMSTLALIMGQTRRLLGYAGLFLALFLAAIPVLGLGDYLTSTKTGADPSSQSHEESLLGGLKYVALHPLGVGPGTIGKWAAKEDANAVGIEDTYLTLAAQYGVVTLFCFLAFLASVLQRLWRERTPSSYVGTGMVAGFGAVIMFAALHDVFPLACWIWFPVGLAIRSTTETDPGLLEVAPG